MKVPDGESPLPLQGSSLGGSQLIGIWVDKIFKEIQDKRIRKGEMKLSHFVRWYDVLHRKSQVHTSKPLELVSYEDHRI